MDNCQFGIGFDFQIIIVFNVFGVCGCGRINIFVLMMVVWNDVCFVIIGFGGGSRVRECVFVQLEGIVIGSVIIVIVDV